jgi:NAD(P)-dependent dehydrogenase (short-subunit alcohol dehydrogenase family)
MKLSLATSLFVALIALVLFGPSIRVNAQEPATAADPMEQALANAQSPAEHQAIASFFRQEATNARTAADYHQQLADENRRLKVAQPDRMAEACDKMASDFKKIADAADRIAETQQHLAKQAESK